MSKKVVGKDFDKLDGLALVKGKPVYTDDLAPDDCLVIKILRSPHAFAKITNIDTARAEKMEGVECVFTYKNVPDILYTRAGQSYPEPSIYDKYILDQYVRHIGDEVALVAAKSESIAKAALKRIKVEYEVYEPVLDILTAEDHPSKIHFEDRTFMRVRKGYDPEKNLACVYNYGYGDVEKELEDSDVVIEHTYNSQAQAHTMMETYRAYSYIDQYGSLVVVSSTQIPFHVRREVAQSLGIPASKVRVIKPRIGGGFGGKQTSQMEFYSALVTWVTKKPSKHIYSRKETFSSSNTRHATQIKMIIGADKDGTIKAMDMHTLSDTGAYGEHAYTVLGAMGYKALPLYPRAKAARFLGKAIYTNRVTAGAFRGYGVTQGIYALESAINELAVALDMDPVEVREKNMIRKGESSEIMRQTTIGAGPEPIPMDSCELEYCMARGKEMFKWDEKYPRQEVSESKVRGAGMAFSMQGSGIPGIDTASATIRLNEQGNFTLLTGAADIGTGSDTILSQIAAEAIGVPHQLIRVHSGDTEFTPFDVGAYASGTTYFSGNAVKKAGLKMRESILEEGAKALDLDKDQVDFDGEKIYAKDGSKEKSLEDFATSLVYRRPHKQLTTTGSYSTIDVAPPFLASFAEVEVDVETGKVELLDFVTVIDCGTVINPKLAKVQAEGGIAQGIGLALFEDVQEASDGKLLTNNMMQYKIPSRLDISNIRVEFADGFDETGPFGAKSIGEVVTNSAAPAIQDAVYNAIGIRIRELPITPEKVKMALLKEGR